MNHDSRSFEDFSSLKADVALIRSNYVTKAELQAVRIDLDGVKMELKEDISMLRVDIEKLRSDMHASLYGQTWRIIGAVSSLVVAVYFIARAGY